MRGRFQTVRQVLLRVGSTQDQSSAICADCVRSATITGKPIDPLFGIRTSPVILPPSCWAACEPHHVHWTYVVPVGNIAEQGSM